MIDVQMTEAEHKEWLAIKEKVRKDTLLKTLQGRLTKQQRNYFDKTFWNLFDSEMIEKIVNVLSPPSVDTTTTTNEVEVDDPEGWDPTDAPQPTATNIVFPTGTGTFE